MKYDINEKMLNASELFYYSKQFSGKQMVLVFNTEKDFESLMHDIIMLQSSGINIIVIIKEHKKHYSKLEFFLKLHLSSSLILIEGFSLSNNEFTKIDRNISDSKISILACNTKVDNDNEFFDSITAIISRYSAVKLLLVGIYSPITDSSKLVRRVLIEKLKENEEFLPICKLHNKFQNISIVILPNGSGNIFKEVFTHLGSGTLLTKKIELELRTAEPKDVEDVYYMMLPYIMSKNILPASLEEILNSISSFRLYGSVNAPIASLQIKEHCDAFEIAKVCTLPRYREKGVTQNFISDLISTLDASEKKYVFAVCVSEAAQRMFLSLGFKKVSRKTLPKTWQEKYDFTRSSKAFKLVLK